MIKQHFLPKGQYFEEPVLKSQVVLHHTVSNSNSYEGDYRTWAGNKERVATAFIITADGSIYNLFPYEFWAHHLYVNAPSNKIPSHYRSVAHNSLLNKQALGIEIDSAGGLKKYQGGWRSTFGSKITDAQEYPEGFRGYYAFQKYTDEQLKSVEYILKNLSQFHCTGIPLTYRDEMWDVSEAALRGDSGIWSHTSYRTDKSDAHPQPELIQMLKGLEVKSVPPSEPKIVVPPKIENPPVTAKGCLPFARLFAKKVRSAT